MNSLFALLIHQASPVIVMAALALFRIFMGTVMAIYGIKKIIAGPEHWRQLGMSMQHFGINFLPTLWGLAATLSFFAGGIGLALGLGTRVAAFFLAVTMSVALNFHMHNYDKWETIAPALVFCVICILFLVIGGSYLSIDQLLTRE